MRKIKGMIAILLLLSLLVFVVVAFYQFATWRPEGLQEYSNYMSTK